MIRIITNKGDFETINTKKVNEIKKQSFFCGRNEPMTWGVVREIDKERGLLSVQLDNGYIVHGVRVGVFGVFNHVNKKGFSGRKAYPEIDSLVLVAFPSDGVPVSLCSAFFVESSQTKEKLIQADEPNIERSIYTAGWNVAYDNEKGNIEIKDDNYISDNKKDSAKDFKLSFDKDKHELVLTWWKKKINLTISESGKISFIFKSGDDNDKELFNLNIAEDGSSIETVLKNDSTNTTIKKEPGKTTINNGDNVKVVLDGSSAGSEKIEVTDSKNKLELDAGQGTFILQDGNENKITSSSTGLNLSSSGSSLDLGSLVRLGISDANNLKILLDNIQTELSNLANKCLSHTHKGSTSAGSPFSHNVTVMPDGDFGENVGKIGKLKTEISNLLK